ncbi:uncharacterized protein LOC133532301 isoform X2 [Cydia pomonella]|uniref:uncharacterized protein LOC133532301 isoform X2 n=1 Tax=Cydia pomonella TaxID=82600 RepID=UPI002ADE119E|nr:uncharacterized protein LOC133532301 isoform X2 [Cydia pomonella]
METDRLMQAVLQSFLDADLRVELVPKSEKFQGRTADTGTGPSYDASTQVAARNANNYKHPEPARMKGHSGHMGQRDSTTQAIDGQYATIYRVQHCKMTPTSPPPMTSEFPPQRPDVAYGCDNFQVGGRGSGETGSVPIKTTSYRGGMNWPNRGDVYTPRMSRCSDSDTFERSLRKYPSVSPERSAEVFERLVTYAMPRASRSPRHSPQREPVRPKTYEETYKYRPRAPEEDPTRDRRNDFNHLREASKQAYAKHSDIRQIREMTRRLRKSLKSISSYTHTHTLSTYLDGIDHECDTPILETSETEHEDSQPAQEFSYPVNTTVQAAVPTTSLGVEAKLTSTKRTIAVPLSPTPSSRLTPGHSSPVATTSLGVDTKPLSISRRTIAVPLSPTPSSRCTTGTDNFANPIDNSIPKASLGVETNSLSICKRTVSIS